MTDWEFFNILMANGEHIMPFWYSFINPVNNFQITILNTSFDMIKLIFYIGLNPFTSLHAFHVVLWIIPLTFIDIINHCKCVFIQICTFVSFVTVHHFAFVVQLFQPTMHCTEMMHTCLNMAATIGRPIQHIKMYVFG